MLHKIKFSEFLNEFELDGNLQNGKYFTIGFVSIDVGLGGDFYRILQSALSKKYQKLNISKVYDFKKLKLKDKFRSFSLEDLLKKIQSKKPKTYEKN